MSLLYLSLLDGVTDSTINLSMMSFPPPPGLFPAVLNLASMANISANATCGETGPEMFCKLVEHVPGQRDGNPQCRVCNLKSDREFGKQHTHQAYKDDNTHRLMLILVPN